MKKITKVFLMIMFLQIIISIAHSSTQDENELIRYILDGIDNNQNKIKNILADFCLTSLIDEGVPDSNNLFLGLEKWIIKDWLWERSKLRFISKRIYKPDFILPDVGKEETEYYGFNGEEALYFIEEKLEKNGYSIREPFEFLGSMSPNNLWFSSDAYPKYLIIEMLKNNYKNIKVEKTKILGAKNINGNKCYILWSQLIIMWDNNYGDRFSLKITVDPAFNFLFREIQFELLEPIPEYMIVEYTPYDISQIYDIEFVEVMSNFFLPKCGKIRYLKKDERGDLKIEMGHKIDITYKGVNLPVEKKDFWFPIRSDLPISNSIYKIRGKNYQDYQQKLEEFMNQFKK